MECVHVRCRRQKSWRWSLRPTFNVDSDKFRCFMNIRKEILSELNRISGLKSEINHRLEIVAEIRKFVFEILWFRNLVRQNEPLRTRASALEELKRRYLWLKKPQTYWAMLKRLIACVVLACALLTTRGKDWVCVRFVVFHCMAFNNMYKSAIIFWQ